MANKKHKETQERLGQDFRHDAERSATMWDKFLTPADIPSIQVKARETVAPAYNVSMTDDHEQVDWLHDFINQTEDNSGVDGRDHQSLDEWLEATFGEAALPDQDEEDETVPNLLNAACSFFHWLEPMLWCFSYMSRFKDAFG